METVSGTRVHKLGHLEQVHQLHVVLQGLAITFVRVDELVDFVAKVGALQRKLD